MGQFFNQNRLITSENTENYVLSDFLCIYFPGRYLRHENDLSLCCFLLVSYVSVLMHIIEITKQWLASSSKRCMRHRVWKVSHRYFSLRACLVCITREAEEIGDVLACEQVPDLIIGRRKHRRVELTGACSRARDVWMQTTLLWRQILPVSQALLKQSSKCPCLSAVCGFCSPLF